MQFEKFISELRVRLKNPLPGVAAHQLMVPPDRPLTAPSSILPSIRESAVLFLIYPINDIPYFCLTKRPKTMKNHAGQFSFPGGKKEKSDPTIEYTALRETCEEIGLKPDGIHLLRQLTQVFVPISRFFIHPVLAFTNQQPSFYPSKSEVEQIIELPLSLLKKENRTTTTIISPSGNRMVPCYLHKQEIIWGATAMILAEMELILRN